MSEARLEVAGVAPHLVGSGPVSQRSRISGLILALTWVLAPAGMFCMEGSDAQNLVFWTAGRRLAPACKAEEPFAASPTGFVTSWTLSRRSPPRECLVMPLLEGTPPHSPPRGPKGEGGHTLAECVCVCVCVCVCLCVSVCVSLSTCWACRLDAAWDLCPRGLCSSGALRPPQAGPCGNRLG